MLEALDLGMGH